MVCEMYAVIPAETRSLGGIVDNFGAADSKVAIAFTYHCGMSSSGYSVNDSLIITGGAGIAREDPQCGQ
jgi:hypothetical protein